MGAILCSKGTANLEVKSSERNRELEDFASLELRVCEVLLYDLLKKINILLKKLVKYTENIGKLQRRIIEKSDFNISSAKILQNYCRKRLKRLSVLVAGQGN